VRCPSSCSILSLTLLPASRSQSMPSASRAAQSLLSKLREQKYSCRRRCRLFHAPFRRPLCPQSPFSCQCCPPLPSLQHTHLCKPHHRHLLMSKLAAHLRMNSRSFFTTLPCTAQPTKLFTTRATTRGRRLECSFWTMRHTCGDGALLDRYDIILF